MGADAILLFSHGSVLCGAERNLLALAARMRARGDAAIVEVGFLNYTEPLFATAVSRCVAQGATRIVIAPYFLVSGKFVVQELPAVIDAARAEHPGVTFVVGDVIGFHPALAEAILSSAASARPTAAWREELRIAGESCRENPKCPLHGSAVCKVPA
ncbi:MAG: sirohydrochlorin cobaltochelatase [Acidobacteriota bacterium]|nr:sirohydrochlorin cobaltochelatase [Acidobacteriota bacterium]